MLIYPKKKALLLNLRYPNKITTLIPSAKTIRLNDKTLVAVRHGVEETKILRNAGIQVPSPIEFHYDWPGKYKPFFAQRATAAFLTLNRRAFVLNEIGTGKSLAVLWAFDFLRKAGILKRALIITPLSTMEPVWADEVFYSFPHYEFTVLYGTREKRFELLKKDADIYIVNHDGAEIIVSNLKDREDIDLVVIDELATAARNGRTKLWKALNEIVNKQTPRWAWGLTGTPMPNSPLDVWGQVRLIRPEAITPFFTRWRDQTMKKVGLFAWVPRSGAAEMAAEVMNPAIRFTRADCYDLPPLMWETRKVELTEKQEKAYRQMLKTLMTEVVTGKILAVNEADKVNKLLQICCGVAYGEGGNEVVIPSEPRLQEVLDIATRSLGKVIVFAPYVSVVEYLSKYLEKAGLSVVTVHGKIAKSQRDLIFHAFQKEHNPRVLVAQPAAMSHGLTLTEANTIIWYAPITRNEIFEQANGRITRAGQKNNQFIVLLEGSEIEKHLYLRLKAKQKIQGILLELVQKLVD